MNDRLRYVNGMTFFRHMYLSGELVLWKFDLRLSVEKFLLATKILFGG